MRERKWIEYENIHLLFGRRHIPFGWEVCFSTVEEYKRKLFEKYTASQEYNDFVIGGFNVLTDKIDVILN